MTDWLIETLPPEAGPVCMWLVANWDTVRPATMSLALGVLFAELLIWRWMAS